MPRYVKWQKRIETPPPMPFRPEEDDTPDYDETIDFNVVRDDAAPVVDLERLLKISQAKIKQRKVPQFGPAKNATSRVSSAYYSLLRGLLCFVAF